MKKVLQIIGGIAVLAVVLIAGIVMGMEHNKPSESSSASADKTEQTVKVKPKKKKKVTKTAVDTKKSSDTNDDSNSNSSKSDSSDKTSDSDAKTQTPKKYFDVPYTCTFKGDTYTLLLKSNGEYIYNLTRANNATADPGITFEKGTYEVNSEGYLRYPTQTSFVFAKWPTVGDIMSTTPTDVSFTGKGSRYPRAVQTGARANSFMIVNDGDVIQGNEDGVDLKPQPGLEVKDPEKVGPELHQQFIDSQNH
ncbi:hypothetical protein [Companilactobacillus bobalius]|uniref:Uncharacterized protein n=2 Tax=Companilactobacillus bobalius TaxID=2801451 RepID=A0A202FF53_9LACO|nr:hypothetical protein [Companilactobacillus bobalius]KAE9560454.1 hypothetical protein ATN92_09830 [Companilactobacillus bobalius]KRK83205.1 hypothetical protein FC78_GL002014 [Companilactobacillus bobalius DSM 19674]OVE99106.1 hypothetical protein LKACC16343_00218 [Companilactobacillus bobalius]GEO57082.1 hypothetical protein LBO01_02110 [Companilactobacillus paralimentarius]